MKIIVIGHPCLDIIHKNEEILTSYGGIIYSLIGFLIAVRKDDLIFPFFQINEEHSSKYFEILNSYPQIKKDLLSISSSQMNVVHLFFDGEQLNFECYQSTSPKIEIKRNAHLISQDSNFYINMISGFELDIEDLKFIRNNFTGKIYFDFHTLTRGMNEEGKRIYRPIENWREWVMNCDVIQMNEIERQNLSPEKFNEEEFAEEAIKSGCKVVNITKGDRGATSYFLEGQKIKRLSIQPETGLKFKSNVGCGDIFGAVFAYNYFRNEKIESCLKEAVKISSRRIEIDKIENIIDKLKKAESDNL